MAHLAGPRALFEAVKALAEHGWRRGADHISLGLLPWQARTTARTLLTSAIETSGDVPTMNDALHVKVTELLDRSVQQSTGETRLELYDRVLDQIVADEVRILRALSDGARSPLVNVYTLARWRTPPRAVLTDVSLISKTAGTALPDLGSVYVGNLLRLGLIEIGAEDPELAAGYEVLLAQPQ